MPVDDRPGWRRRRLPGEDDRKCRVSIRAGNVTGKMYDRFGVFCPHKSGYVVRCLRKLFVAKVQVRSLPQERVSQVERHLISKA